MQDTSFYASKPGDHGVKYFSLGGKPPSPPDCAVLVLPYPSGTVKYPEIPSGRIGAFAPVHWYKVVVASLKALGRTFLNAGEVHGGYEIFCNSNRLAEKTAAVRAGAGFIGKQSLLVNPDFGPRCVIGVLSKRGDSVLRDADARAVDVPDGAFIPGAMCGSCDICVKACPTGAILPGGGIVKERCLQFYASRDMPLPQELMSVWGNRLYGCDECSASCPMGMVNGGLPPEDGPGYLGEWLDLSFILSAFPDALDGKFKGTALGMKFIASAALKRNALLAAGCHFRTHGVDGRFEPFFRLIESYAQNENAALSGAASHSIQSIR